MTFATIFLLFDDKRGKESSGGEKKKKKRFGKAEQRLWVNFIGGAGFRGSVRGRRCKFGRVAL